MSRIRGFLAAFATCFIVTASLSAVTTVSAATTPNPSWSPTGSWSEVFSDGFGGTSLKTSNWTPSWFGGAKSGPVNSEENAGYNSSNVSVSGGDLHLNLTKQSITTPNGTFPYTGALISSDTHFDFTYGAVEFYANLPARASGQPANWPALWTDGEGTWPKTGEMDVMEGLEGDTCFHFHDPSGGPGDCVSGTWSGWHRFGADWEKGKVTFYYDSKKVGEITSGITGSPMYLILENTINKDDNATTPADMEVSWVRVWKPAAETTAKVLTKPSADYAMTDSCGDGSYCTETVTIKNNPSAYNVRAWMNCTKGSGLIAHYGGWHTSGTSTAGCGTGGQTGVDAGFQYDKTHQYVADCWLESDPRTGSC